LRRPALARRRLPPGHRVGLAGGADGGRVAAGPPRRQGGRAALRRGVPAAPGRGVHRLAERDLRRGAAVHPAWVRGAGMERGRGVALLDRDRAVMRGGGPMETPQMRPFGGTVSLWWARAPEAVGYPPLEGDDA